MEHLDANTVAAFSARALNSTERSQVFEHLSGCDACREWIVVNSELNPRNSGIPAWALAAAGIACAGFILWLSAAHSAGEPPQAPAAVAERQLPVTLTLMDPRAGIPQRGLPLAWKQVRLVPDFVPLPANQVSLKTTVGQKWIAVDRLFESIGESVVP